MTKADTGGDLAAWSEVIQQNANRAILPSSDADDEETYEIGKRDGYEQAIQDLDIATGGDGEFKGSSFPGETIDVAAMKARIVERCRPPAVSNSDAKPE